MRTLTTLLALLALGASLTPARAALLRTGPTTGPARHVVILANGSAIGARTRPVIAFGKVSFMSTAGKMVALDVRGVDVPATRARAGRAATPATRLAWNDRNLSETTGRVQVLGEDDGPQPPEVQRHEQIDLLHRRIEDVEDRIAELGPDHPSTPRLMKAQLELQAEVSRLLHGPHG